MILEKLKTSKLSPYDQDGGRNPFVAPFVVPFAQLLGYGQRSIKFKLSFLGEV